MKGYIRKFLLTSVVRREKNKKVNLKVMLVVKEVENGVRVYSRGE